MKGQRMQIKLKRKKEEALHLKAITELKPVTKAIIHGSSIYTHTPSPNTYITDNYITDEALTPP